MSFVIVHPAHLEAFKAKAKEYAHQFKLRANVEELSAFKRNDVLAQAFGFKGHSQLVKHSKQIAQSMPDKYFHALTNQTVFERALSSYCKIFPDLSSESVSKILRHLKQEDARICVVVLMKSEGEEEYYTGVLAKEFCNDGLDMLAIAIGNRAIERNEVESYIQILADKPAGHRHNNTYLQKIETILPIAAIEESYKAAFKHSSQVFVCVYMGEQWYQKLITNGGSQNEEFLSISDIYDVPVSKSYREKQAGIEKFSQIIQGEESLLEGAILLAQDINVDWDTDYEEHQAIRSICDWWNGIAPSELANADVFMLYIWDDSKRKFISGDVEEPSYTSTELLEFNAIAAFPYKHTIVAVVFGKGSAHNKILNDWATSFTADGKIWQQTGCDLKYINVSRISMESLQQLPILAVEQIE